MISAVLHDKWRDRAPATYRKHFSVMRTFFEWHRAFASLLIQAGAPVVEVARQLGKAPSVTLATYRRVLEDHDSSVTVTPAEAKEGARTGLGVREKYARAGGHVTADTVLELIHAAREAL